MSKLEIVQQDSMQIMGMTCAACANRIEKGLVRMQWPSAQ